MSLSVKKATADSVSSRLQKYLDTTNILQYPKEEFARFDFFGLRTCTGIFVVLKNCPRIKIFKKFLSYPNKICPTSHRTKIFRKVSENFCPRIKIFRKVSETFYPIL